ncbi:MULTISPECIES: hypothetical protein [Dermacoccus]|uniref:hypothetical protein n=1 Tax=Dermacoccus TaxID=57495 RepID=UPI000B049EF9|nr:MULTISPECIES: hypothetical protein [Dermacoccus]MBO1757576.1 hypothetical protein [Dermacoccus sp. NHGro5]
MTSWTSGRPNMTSAVNKGERVWSNITTPSANVPHDGTDHEQHPRDEQRAALGVREEAASGGHTTI